MKGKIVIAAKVFDFIYYVRVDSFGGFTLFGYHDFATAFTNIQSAKEKKDELASTSNLFMFVKEL